MRSATLIIAISFVALAGCGGDDAPTAGGGPTGSVTPPPPPPPAPPPPPPPPSTPAVNPQPPTRDPGGALLGDLLPPGGLSASLICSKSQVGLSGGRVAQLAPTTATYLDRQTIQVSSDYVYSYDINGFGGPTFGAGSRKGGTAFERFFIGDDATGSELQIAKAAPLEYATLGLTYYYDLCFYAAAPAGNYPAPSGGQVTYGGLADGLYESRGDQDRLFGTTAHLLYNSATKTYSFSMTLKTVEDAFLEPAGQPQTALGTASATLAFDPQSASFPATTITATGGFTGTVRGTLAGTAYIAGLFTFDLTNPAGDRIWGVVAADGALI